MHVSNTSTVGEDNVFHLPSAMTIDTVDALAISLHRLELKPPVLVLDASRTEIISTPGVQLLLAFAKKLEAHTIGLSIRHHKPVFAQTFEQLGLASQFSQWESSHG